MVNWNILDRCNYNFFTIWKFRSIYIMYLQSPVNLFLSTYVYITHITSPYNTNFSPWLEKKKILRPPTTSFSSSRVSFTNCSSTNCPCLLQGIIRARKRRREKNEGRKKQVSHTLSLPPPIPSRSSPSNRTARIHRPFSSTLFPRFFSSFLKSSPPNCEP